MMFIKLKAGALQLTTFVVVVIALLLASFIVLLQSHKRFSIQTDFVLETIDNAQKGIDYALQNPLLLNKVTAVNGNDEDYKTISVKRDFWGVFEKVTSTSSIKTKVFTKTALIGATQSKTNRTVLYVKDNNKPLVVVGNTKIQGTAHLPRQGIRPGNISGQSYYGSQLIYGQSKLSTDIPQLPHETVQQIKNISSNNFDFQQHQFLDLDKNRVYKNSFNNPLQVIYSNESIILSDVNLTGHITVRSGTKIIVDATAMLKDVLLIAPEIDIKSNTKGRFQAFATKKVTVGKNCKLNYPSALILNKKENSLEQDHLQDQDSAIVIESGAIINGVVLYLGKTKKKNYQPQLGIEENAIVKGEVYCTQNLELKGSVYGTVFTNNFVARQSGSIYQNHIYNGTISVDELPIEYVGLLFKNAKKDVLQWLY